MKFIEFIDVIFETTNLSISKYDDKKLNHYILSVQNNSINRNTAFDTIEERDAEYNRFKEMLIK
jgi:hypothetical protein